MHSCDVSVTLSHSTSFPGSSHLLPPEKGEDPGNAVESLHSYWPRPRVVIYRLQWPATHNIAISLDITRKAYQRTKN